MGESKKVKEENKNEEIKTFTPPKGGQQEEAVCYKHPTEEAYTKCDNCGKYICKDCAESCSLDDGTHLCYDCCELLFQEQERKLKRDKNKIVSKFALTIMGVLIGIIMGISDGLAMAFILAVLFGSFLTAIKPISQAFVEIIKGIFNLATDGIAEGIGNIISAVIMFLVAIVRCTIETTVKLISYTRYLIQANKAIQQTQAALQQLSDFMQYMEVKEKQKNFDLDTLLSEGNELYNNSYAQALKNDGEQAADQMLCRATTIIAENGEIIRNFAV